MFGSIDDIEGRVVAPGVAVAVAVGGGGTVAAPGVGVGLGSAMFEVMSVFTLFGRGELGSEGGICWLGVSLRSFEAVLDIVVSGKSVVLSGISSILPAYRHFEALDAC